MEHSDIEHMAHGYPPAHIGKDCEEVIVWLATQLLATQKQRDALASESAGLKLVLEPKQIPDEIQDLFNDTVKLDGDSDGYHEWSWVDNPDEVIIAVMNAMPKPETPATDAYLNAVRAGAVEDAAKRLFGQGYTFEILTRFAAQLRAGKDGE